MMGNYGSMGVSLLFGLHCLFAITLGIGIITLFIWLYRDAKKATLRKVMMAALLIGGIGLLLTAPFAMQRGFNSHMQGFGIEMMGDVDDDLFPGMMFRELSEVQEVNGN